MELEPITTEVLSKQYEILKTKGLVGMEIAFHLARFAEAVAFIEGNRQIEELQKQVPKTDDWRIEADLRSSLFTYFLWMLPPGIPGRVLIDLADEAAAAVQDILGKYKEG